MANLTDNLFKSRRVKVYQVSEGVADKRKNLPNNYRTNMFKNAISSHIFRNKHVISFLEKEKKIQSYDIQTKMVNWEKNFTDVFHTCFCSYDCAIEYSANKSFAGHRTLLKSFLN